VLKYRERQRRGAVMRPSTFAAIERRAAAGGAYDPAAVAGAAYWKTLAAKYRGNPDLEKTGGLHIVYSAPNQAYFLMWYDSILRIFQTKAEAKAEMDYLLRSRRNPGDLACPYCPTKFTPAEVEAGESLRHISQHRAERHHALDELAKARRAYESAKTQAAKRAAADDLEFWGNKAAAHGSGRGGNPGESEPLGAMSRELQKYWLEYFKHVGLSPAQAKIAYELHRKGSSPETAIYLAKQRANPRELNPREKQRKFRDVSIGETFEFWDPWRSSMRGPWIKKSARTYVLESDPGGIKYRVGSISAKVLPPGVLSNPDDELPEAERLYETFHGREPREILELTDSAVERGEYVNLGDLVELTIVAPDRNHVKVGFKDDGVRLASTAEGTQLVLIGGNQDISRTLGMFGAEDTSKDLLDLGDLKQIVYDAAKWQTDFTPQEWKHDLGEESGIRPRVLFNQLKKRIFFAGGTYRVERPGIVD
jgi:hypothetical protein